jgi:uncharacterized protein
MRGVLRLVQLCAKMVVYSSLVAIVELTPRTFWLSLIESAWKRRSVVWVAGVRRSGKTCLSQTLPDAEYWDCELPSTRQRLEDPEQFWRDSATRYVVLDEVHRLGNPSEVLKIASDHFPHKRVLATGSSSLGASRKFRDTLSGRKADILLTPMITADLADFGSRNIRWRLERGGLPPFLMSNEFQERDFQDWLDAFWSKDIQELFRVERRSSFQKFTELLMAQSGSIFEATRFSAPCEVSRTTISSYLSVLEETYVIHVIRPFSSRRSTEIVSAPRTYAFDTGFVTIFKGWRGLRQEDYGVLWEHYVLNELIGVLQTRRVQYWRDKQGHEVDFVLSRFGQPPCAIECKWSWHEFVPDNLIIFRKHYAGGPNYVVCQNVDQPFKRRFKDIEATFLPVHALETELQEQVN